MGTQFYANTCVGIRISYSAFKTTTKLKSHKDLTGHDYDDEAKFCPKCGIEINRDLEEDVVDENLIGYDSKIRFCGGKHKLSAKKTCYCYDTVENEEVFIGKFIACEIEGYFNYDSLSLSPEEYSKIKNELEECFNSDLFEYNKTIFIEALKDTFGIHVIGIAS